MIKLAIDLYMLHALFGGDQQAVLGAVSLAERCGFDQVCLGDHVIMGEDTSTYPFGEFPAGLDYPWMEPLTMLTAIAARTTSIRLCTGVLLSPLRPTVLLAKQAATLDVLSQGRLDLGIGVGWQEAEFVASNVRFASRAAILREQAVVLKKLWTEIPTSFRGDHHCLEQLHSNPPPVQTGGVPIWFGVPPTSRNIALIADLGHGWMPLGLSLERTAATIADLRSAFAARGRNADDLHVSHIPSLYDDQGRPVGLERAFTEFEKWVAIGVNVLRILPVALCTRADELEEVFVRLVAWRDAIRE